MSEQNQVFSLDIEEDDDDLFDYGYEKPGSIPGTLSIEDDATPPEIILIDYTPREAIRVNNLTPEDCQEYMGKDSISWFNVGGLGNKNFFLRLGKIFNLHPLILEDIVNVPQKPKIEENKHQLVIIANMVIPKPPNQGQVFWLEQVSLVVTKQYVLTVQEEPKRDCFEPIRQRIRFQKGNIRDKGADYLAYALWDAIIDGFFPVLDVYSEQIEELEDEVITNPNSQTLAKIYQVRRELLALRRAIWSQRTALSTLIRDGSPLISDEIILYFRDCYDHAVQIVDLIETYRELSSGLTDIYLSAVSNKMNEIMKLLTVISTIFIPLTFIAGIYGMNFNTVKSPWNMPELNYYWGYPLCLSLMFAIASGLIIFFWQQGWFEKVIFDQTKKRS
jgi:magnesium transporter